MNTMKQTELGEIPEDWEVVELGDLAEILRGASPRPIDNPIWFSQNSETGWLRITDVTKSYKYLYDTIQNLSELGIKHSRYVAENNLIMSICATVGRPIINKKKICIHDGFVLFQNPKFNIEFMFYVLEKYETEWSKQGQIGSQMNLNTNLIKHTKIILPSGKEQTAIATVLSDTDELINSIEKLLQKKQAIKTATMQQLLTGKTRLPDFACFSDGTPKDYLKTELGEIPEDWEVVELGEISVIKSGGTPSTLQPAFWNGEINWCTPTDITTLSGKYLYKTKKQISKLGLDNSAADLLPLGSILMTSRATVGECAIAMQPMTTNQGFKNFICNDKSDNEFLYYLLVSQKLKFIALCSGSTFLEISTTQVRSFKIPLPPKTEQTAIATILSDMDTEIRALSERLHKVRLLKQGLMQQLLSGKIRLPC